MRGRVQGVFFRAFTRQTAQRLGVTGYVRNREDGSVETRAEGDRGQLEKLLEYLREGPSHAHVDSIEVDWSEESGQYSEFTIEY
ncbi:MAG: acylphosphatase [Dehalococcoidales bacterium]|nr:acylphosphatase [Dehalococcoidales bacterium]